MTLALVLTLTWLANPTRDPTTARREHREPQGTHSRLTLTLTRTRTLTPTLTLTLSLPLPLTLTLTRIAPRCSCPTSEEAGVARQATCRGAEPKLSVPPPPTFAAELAR